MSIILGIDPGLGVSGFAIAEKKNFDYQTTYSEEELKGSPEYLKKTL